MNLPVIKIYLKLCLNLAYDFELTFQKKEKKSLVNCLASVMDTSGDEQKPAGKELMLNRSRSKKQA